MMTSIILPALISVVPTTVSGQLNMLRILPAPNYVGIQSRGYCSGGSCQLYDMKRIGDAAIDVVLWGLGGLQSAASGQATMTIETGGILHTVSQWTLNQVPSSYTMAYHEIIYGSKPWNTPVVKNAAFLDTPIQVSQAPRILIATNYSIIRAQYGANMAFEAWLFTNADNSRAPRAGDLEIMVELRSGVNEDSAKRGSISNVPLIVNGQLVYRNFDIIMYDSDWTFIKFKPQQGVDRGYVIFDYVYFIEAAKNFLRSIGWSKGGSTADTVDNMYIMSLELGTEVFTGTSTPANINVEWYMYDYVIVTAPKSMSTEQALQQAASMLISTPTTSPTTTATPTTTTTLPTTTTTPTTVTPTVTVVTVFVTDIVSVPLTLPFTTPITTTVTTTVPVTLIIPVRVTTTITTTSPVTTTTSPTTTATPTTTTTTTTLPTITTTTSAPGVRYSFTLSANSRVATVSGCIEFRVSGGSTTIGGVTVSPGSVLKICVNNDNALTWWIGTDGWLSANDLDASAVYVNGNQVSSNTKISLSGIQADLSTINSTLTITVTGTGQTSLTWNGQTVISGTDSRTLTISGVAPTTSKAMNLNIGTTTIYADATATNYTLQ